MEDGSEYVDREPRSDGHSFILYSRSRYPAPSKRATPMPTSPKKERPPTPPPPPAFTEGELEEALEKIQVEVTWEEARKLAELCLEE